MEGFILTVSGLLPLITLAKLSKHKELFAATLVKVFIQIKLGPKWLSLLSFGAMMSTAVYLEEEWKKLGKKCFHGVINKHL